MLKQTFVLFSVSVFSVLLILYLSEQKMSGNVVKTVGLSSKDHTRKRKHSSSDEEDSRTSNLHSIVKVKERK